MRLFYTAVGLAIGVIGFTFSGMFNSRYPSPHELYGRYQMRVTEKGTIVVMDTMTGQVTNVTSTDDFHHQ
jgi:hypothetical protein